MNNPNIQIQQVLGTSWTNSSRFQQGDLIQSINGHQMNTLAEVFSALEKAIPLAGAEVTVLRVNIILTYKLTL